MRKAQTLDPAVGAVGDDPEALSTTVNAILLAEVQRREVRAALERFLDRLDERQGETDPTAVDRFHRLLS